MKLKKFGKFNETSSWVRNFDLMNKLSELVEEFTDDEVGLGYGYYSIPDSRTIKVGVKGLGSIKGESDQAKSEWLKSGSDFIEKLKESDCGDWCIIEVSENHIIFNREI